MVDPSKNLVPQLGILALELNEDLEDLLPFLRADNGVLVAAIPAGATKVYDFKPGDVIYSVNGVEIQSLDDLHSDLRGRKKGDVIVLQIEREGQLQFVILGIE